MARTRDEIEVRVGLGRVGRELFPALILVVALAMAAEQLLANRFYTVPSAGGREASARDAECGRARAADESRAELESDDRPARDHIADADVAVGSMDFDDRTALPTRCQSGRSCSSSRRC